MAVNIEFGNIQPFDCKGHPTSVGPRWRRWNRSFEFFLEEKAITKDAQKQALLLHCTGQDVQDIFVTLCDSGPAPEEETQYAKAMRLLDGHFLPQVNIPFKRHQFRQAKQEEESETTDQFVTRLFQLSKNCDFGTSKEEQKCDQLIDKCRSHDLRKKLLAVSDKLTLRKARDVARSMEAAESQARSIESDSRSGNVNSLERGHFDSPKRGGGQENVVIDIELRGVRLEGVLVDSSSTCNVIDRATWETLKEKRVKCVSRKSNRKLYSYGSNEPLTTAGEFETELCYKDKRCHVCFIVVYEKAIAILSRETSEELAILKLEINAIEEENLCRNFPECFEGVGKLKDSQANLHVDTSVKPVAQKLRPPPYGLRDKIEQKLKELVNCDIVEPVEGPTLWVSPVVVVPKHWGDIRLLVDIRKANEAIVRERHLIPTVDDILYQLNGSKVFSKLDLKWGFHQIELEQQSRVITTFITHKGLSRYKRLMFGISSASELYQHTIQQVLAGCEGAYNICDDIFIHGRTVEEHDSRLQKTIKCISDKGLTLNPEMCVFRMPQLTFMGYLLSRKGIGPTESRVDAVVRAKEPTNAEEVRSFLGLVNFSARFIPNLASISEPLRELTRKDVPFKWGTEQGAAFEILKSKLGRAETLAYFDRNAEATKLITDASPVGLGAVLTQNIWTEMRKFLTAHRTTPHTSAGVTPAKLLFNREIRSKIPELGNSRYSDSEARDKDAEMKQERTDYADGKRRARESDLVPGVNMRRNVADVKKYLREDTTADEQVAEDDSSEEDDTGRRTELQGRPVRERRPPEYLKDYEVYELSSVKE
ncbi:Retrovirus-related Pol polyprotein [Stylophora pistillata]|uniref:Retrovirus-related Pol polyprotein n=1 Tax=Stylophora pistillata TaxID=50429 RepID=A0A2B4R7R2_STYPI|nr:Retrovirus-related Pol polyprotein [Stylophora pistillata]